MPLYIGAHTISNGGIHMAVRRAARCGMRAIQVFTAKPQFYNEDKSIRPERVKLFLTALAGAQISPSNVLVHSGYVINVATHDEVKWRRAAAALAKELERTTTLGAVGVCFHPGSAGDGDREKSLENVSRAMRLALEKVPGNTRLLIENTAGAGNTVGRTEAEVAAMLAGIPERLRGRAGYGLDTCHLFASGYELSRSAAHFSSIIDAFQRETGLFPSFFHLNDSATTLGSNRDRHALVGEGHIGKEVFRWLLADPRAQDVPLILETPQENPGIAADDDSPDPWDERMMQLLGELSPE
jgi:deoxyribonuclease-4